ncbi:hypothetical protein FRB94_000854 [Tulasnella sp. JGI-2019a]|nr:hypothetical protein FRB94_000854 [Tulasnella sp. JGI-2019a]
MVSGGLDATSLSSGLAAEFGELYDKLLAHFDRLPVLVASACNAVSNYPDQQLLKSILRHLRVARVAHVLIFQGVFFDAIPQDFPSTASALLEAGSWEQHRRNQRTFLKEVATYVDRCERTLGHLNRVREFWSQLSDALRRQADQRAKIESRAWFTSAQTLAMTTRLCADAAGKVSGEVESMWQTITAFAQYWARITQVAELQSVSDATRAVVDEGDRIAWSKLAERTLFSSAVSLRIDAVSRLRHEPPQVFEPRPREYKANR